jgi:hypothetical protein
VFRNVSGAPTSISSTTPPNSEYHCHLPRLSSWGSCYCTASQIRGRGEHCLPQGDSRLENIPPK